MSWFNKRMKYHYPLRSNVMPPEEDDGTMIVLAGQDLAYAVQRFIEEKYDVDAQWVTFTMEETKPGVTSLRVLTKVYERAKLLSKQKEVPHASDR